MQLCVTYETPFQLHRPDSVAAAVFETDSVTVSWKGRRTYIFSQSSRVYRCARVVSVLIKLGVLQVYRVMMILVRLWCWPISSLVMNGS